MEYMRFLSGRSNQDLAKKVAAYLGVHITEMDIKRFSDGEVFIEIKESIRGNDVYVLQSTCPPVNENLMELLIILDACKRASARSINVIIPYFGYARQDRKVTPRTPITSRLVADMLQVAGATRVLSVDLHSGQIQGFFNMPFDNIYAAPVLLNKIEKSYKGDNLVIVSPDAGGVDRARWFANKLGCPLAIVDKRRYAPNQAQVMNLIGDVKDSVALILDDMIDTAGTLCNTALAVMNNGAKKVIAAATHGVLSGPAVSRIHESVLEEVLLTDTIPLSEQGVKQGKIKVLSISSLLGEAVKRIHSRESVSSLFI
ncbi:MAG: ribose-phosphate pyrophosphokinase [Oligoflexia bacterium]|nr:ribose-phosphate pyrophosphokinase [Oligoflexia bacterium]